MKRILFALAAGIVFVTGYLFAIALIVVLSGNYGLIRYLRHAAEFAENCLLLFRSPRLPASSLTGSHYRALSSLSWPM